MQRFPAEAQHRVWFERSSSRFCRWPPSGWTDACQHKWFRQKLGGAELPNAAWAAGIRDPDDGPRGIFGEELTTRPAGHGSAGGGRDDGYSRKIAFTLCQAFEKGHAFRTTGTV